MSAEENRAAGNLLLLCTFHSRLVDARDNPYSVEQLREWKQAQLAQGGGSSITDEQAQEIIQLSFRSEVHMRAETISLGGSFGGGGGAIGAGAVGGPGGDRIYIDASGIAPGGGGGAVMGKTSPPPDGRRATLGVGHIPGLDGGDSSFGVQGDDRPLVSAPGAACGPPYSERTTSGRFAVSAMFCTNHVELHNNLFYVLGGGWTYLDVLNTPCDINLVIALIIEAGGVPEGSYSITLSMRDPDNVPCGTTRFPFIVETPGDILRIAYWAPIAVRISDYGLYHLAASTAVSELAKIGLAVRRTTDATPAS